MKSTNFEMKTFSCLIQTNSIQKQKIHQKFQQMIKFMNQLH